MMAEQPGAEAQKRAELRKDIPNWSGAFPGGPPQISVEEARQIIEDPEAVRQAYLARLKARKAALAED